MGLESAKLYEQTPFMRYLQKQQQKPVGMPISPSTYAITGELGVNEPDETFNVYNIDKVNRTNGSQNITHIGTVKSHYVDPFKAKNHNPSLSFMRGQVGANIPLYRDAVWANNGYLGANVNVIC